jgi:hypothetical protein
MHIQSKSSHVPRLLQSVPESSFQCFHITKMVVAVAVAVVGVMITLVIST